MMFDAKLWMKTWKCPPQVKDLPRDGHIDVTCRSCRSQWRQSVRSLIEDRRLGAQFLDLVEWEMRCQDKACGGMVCFAVPGEDEDEYDLLVAA